MDPLHIQSPFYRSAIISKRTNKNVFLKLEAYQPTGSFKIRGIGYLCFSEVAKGHDHLVCASGGNAGLAVAHAANILGVKAMVYVPTTTDPHAATLIEAEGAELIRLEGDWQEAHEAAVSAAQQAGAAYIHPYDNPLIWEGHATMIEEIANTEVKPDVIILSVGGGGLLCGVLTGLHEIGWADVPVIAAETTGTDSFAQSLAAGQLVTLDKVQGIATSLGARQVCAQALEWSKLHQIIPWVVEDAEALSACQQFAQDRRLLVEPACGAALSAVYSQSDILSGFENIAVIVCGGINISR